MKKIFLFLIIILSFTSVNAADCNGIFTPGAYELIRDILGYITIGVPILLVILCASDLTSIVISQDEKAAKNAASRIVKRFIAAAAFFFVPLIVRFVLGLEAVKNSLNLVDDPLCGVIDDITDTDGSKPNEEKKEEKPVEEQTKTYIESITAKGVLVTVKVKAVEGVKAYYFTYNDSKFPNKNAGYIETTNEEINVGRLPGTTYIWVEDKNGKISKAETITIDNSTILNTKSPITKGTRLYDVLKNKGSSYQEFDKLIARTARAAGAYSKESAATVAVTLVSVLDKEYGVRIPYRAGGKYNNLGINYNWGAKIDDKNYPYNGMDCDGFTHWSYYNAGLKINTSREHNYWYWERMPFSKEKVEIGDIISQYEPNAHVKIVVGFTLDGIITAHANGTNAGVWINEQKYSSIDSKYTIIKGSKIASYYEKNAALGSGF